ETLRVHCTDIGFMQKAIMRKRKLFWAKTGVILAAIPCLIWAYEYGPDAGYSGVPGENGGQTCSNSACHGGRDNQFSRSVTVAFPGGQQYTPGVKQHLMVTITDPAQRAWGFQLTARVASSTGTLAGTFASTDASTLVMCSSQNTQIEKELDFGASQTCA